MEVAQVQAIQEALEGMPKGVFHKDVNPPPSYKVRHLDRAGSRDVTDFLVEQGGLPNPNGRLKIEETGRSHYYEDTRTGFVRRSSIYKQRDSTWVQEFFDAVDQSGI